MEHTSFRKIPTSIITGFLGSGKTTLLRHILANANGKRIAVIVNEFGEMGIDGELLRCPIDCTSNEETLTPVYELANGCICCTVQEEFFPVMLELVSRRDSIDHIVIETSGLALPKPLVQAFQWPAIKQACTVDAVITVVDAPAVVQGMFAHNPQTIASQRLQDPNLDHESPLQELFEDQLLMADLVLVNKTDLISDADWQKVYAIVQQEVDARVKIVACKNGCVAPEIVLGLQQAVEDRLHERKSHHEDAQDDHDHEAFNSIHIKLPKLGQQHAIDLCQQLIDDFPIIRLKGLFHIEHKPMRMVIQGVGKRMDNYFDRAWRKTESPESVLVLIGQALQEHVIRRKIDQFLSQACIC